MQFHAHFIVVIAVSSNCGCNGLVYSVPLIATKTAGSWISTIANASIGCEKAGYGVTLLDSADLDMQCLDHFRANLSTQFPLASTSDIWLAKNGSQCVKFISATNTIERGPCVSTENLIYFCQHRITTSKYILDHSTCPLK